jgi:outer membrane protein TolC
MRIAIQRITVGVLLLCMLGGCRPEGYRQEADKIAYGIIDKAQKQVLGRAEPFTVESPTDALRKRLLLDQDLPYAHDASLGTSALKPIEHWPEDRYPFGPAESTDEGTERKGSTLVLGLAEVLQIAARSNRDYQGRKEDVFRSALSLDLEANDFRDQFFAGLDSQYSADYGGNNPVRGLANTGDVSWERRFKNGTQMTARFAVDLAKLLTADRSSSLGLFADATITVPLLRGAGRHIVAEPLTQAERDVMYAMFSFERFKRTLAVRVASEYLSVLQQVDQIRNAEDNYRGLIISTRRARRLADAGRLPKTQVDQVLQDEFRARDRWISAKQAYARRLDTFKITLGLPTDARVELDRAELERLVSGVGEVLVETGRSERTDASALPADSPANLDEPDAAGGPMEMAADKAIALALDKRLDLQTTIGRVFDAQRRVVVTADALKAGLSVAGSASAGGRRGVSSADQPGVRFRPEKGQFSLGLALDLPLERSAERRSYRESFIALERATRDAQALEDQVKLDVRNSLRTLLQARESYRIQDRAVKLAQGRVDSTELFFQSGRAEIRDVLEAQEALISAKNALTAALVDYRITELELQRDMGVLQVDEKGNWHEYTPE